MLIEVPEASQGQVGELAFDRERGTASIVKAEPRVHARWWFWHQEEEGVPDSVLLRSQGSLR